MSIPPKFPPLFRRASSAPVSEVQYASSELQLKAEISELKTFIGSTFQELRAEIVQLRKEASLQAIQQQLIRTQDSSKFVKPHVTYSLLTGDLLHPDFERKMSFTLDAVGGYLKELR